MTAKKKAKSSARKRSTAQPRAGTKLTREFKGKKVTVHVTDDGFRFAGKDYTSLTAVARQVTGYASVSGPRFFGLVGPGAKGARE